jgi:hypothetical protein
MVIERGGNQAIQLENLSENVIKMCKLDFKKESTSKHKSADQHFNLGKMCRSTHSTPFSAHFLKINVSIGTFSFKFT